MTKKLVFLILWAYQLEIHNTDINFLAFICRYCELLVQWFCFGFFSARNAKTVRPLLYGLFLTCLVEGPAGKFSHKTTWLDIQIQCCKSPYTCLTTSYKSAILDHCTLITSSPWGNMPRTHHTESVQELTSMRKTCHPASQWRANRIHLHVYLLAMLSLGLGDFFLKISAWQIMLLTKFHGGSDSLFAKGILMLMVALEQRTSHSATPRVNFALTPYIILFCSLCFHVSTIIKYMGKQIGCCDYHHECKLLRGFEEWEMK